MTAILFLIFNRPDTTQRVFEAIRAARPTRLYVAADGPRNDREGEAALCAQVRRIATGVDWPCEVRTLFRPSNNGCKRAVESAIDWFFTFEREGIIIEDDCLPADSFFPFCEELLERYRDDERIMAISGTSFLSGSGDYRHSYFFSKHPHMWGWATWRRAWKLYDRDLSGNDDGVGNEWLEAWSDGSPGFAPRWQYRFDLVRRGELDAWGYAWIYSCWRQHGLTCQPVANLVKNIGFGVDATHTRQKGVAGDLLSLEHMEFPLRHPPVVIRSPRFDRITDRLHWGLVPEPTPHLAKRLKARARRIIERSPGGDRAIAYYRRILYGPVSQESR